MRTARRAASAASLLQALLDCGPLPRSAIAQRTGLSPASVTGHSADLVSAGLVAELPEARGPGGIGRPRVPLDLNTGIGVVGGIHLGVRNATVALLDIRGRCLAQRSVRHDGAGPDAVIARSGDILEQLLARSGAPGRLLGVGAASGGWVDRHAGMIIDHPGLGWRRVRVAARLQRRFGVPAFLDSHARALVRAEQLFGHRRSRESVLLLFIGNVVEAAFALGDQVHYGPASRAGAIAHLEARRGGPACSCGRTGCLEVTVSGQRLAARAQQAGIIAAAEFDDLVTAALAGDRRARQLLYQRAGHIGRAIGPIIDVLGPALVSVVEPAAARLPGCLQVLRASIGDASATVTDPDALVTVSSFSAVPLPAAAGAVILDAIYRDPLGVVPPRADAAAVSRAADLFQCRRKLTPPGGAGENRDMAAGEARGSPRAPARRPPGGARPA